MKILKLIIFLLLPGLTGAQDIIHTKNGEEIPVKIIDVSPGVIKYKKFENLNGPVFSIASRQVEKITYEGGKTEKFQQKEMPGITSGKGIQPDITRPSSTFGWYIGFGASNIKSDLVPGKWQVASTIGASFNLSLGTQGSLLFGANILSIGCGLEDDAFYDPADSAYYQITNWMQDMGYIGLEAMYRQYFNTGRNYFLGMGMYGAFLVNASLQGDATITDTIGNVTSVPFQDDMMAYYKHFDYGIVAGGGGRIALGESKKWHVTLEARFYYGLQNIFDYKSHGLMEIRESNLYGLILLGVDIPTKSSD